MDSIIGAGEKTTAGAGAINSTISADTGNAAGAGEKYSITGVGA